MAGIRRLNHAVLYVSDAATTLGVAVDELIAVLPPPPG